MWCAVILDEVCAHLCLVFCYDEVSGSLVVGFPSPPGCAVSTVGALRPAVHSVVQGTHPSLRLGVHHHPNTVGVGGPEEGTSFPRAFPRELAPLSLHKRL